MALDRYIAISTVNVVARNSIKNTSLFCIGLWCVVLVLNIPQLILHEQYIYENPLSKSNRSVCILKYAAKEVPDIKEIQIYHLFFFLFAYVIPATMIIIIYGLILNILIRSKGQQLNKNKTRITFMTIAVVASFVICWAPLQVVLFMQHVINFNFVNSIFFLRSFQTSTSEIRLFNGLKNLIAIVVLLLSIFIL